MSLERVNLLKALFCRHKKLGFWGNDLSTGKEICRSLWKCQRCGILVKRSFIAIDLETGDPLKNNPQKS